MKELPQYDFNKKEKPILEFEILRLENLIKSKFHLISKPHQLNFHQLIFISEGSGEHTVDFKKIKFQKDSFIPVAKDQVQQFDINSTIKGYIVVFTSEFLISEKINYRFLHDFSLFNSQLSPFVLKCTAKTRHLLKMLIRAYSDEIEFEQEELLRNYLKIILIQLEQNKRSFSQKKNESSLSLIMQFKEVLDSNISYKVKVADICKILDINPKKLNAALKIASKKTAKEYLDERVILEIKRQLSFSRLSIKEIAYNIGFEDASNLTKYFKKHTSFSPKTFRQFHT